MKKWIVSNKLYLIGASFGAIAGLLYYKYVGCIIGTCAITSNPYRSTLYGAFSGAILIRAFKPANKQSSKKI